jgi:hypothetical protein
MFSCLNNDFVSWQLLYAGNASRTLGEPPGAARFGSCQEGRRTWRVNFDKADGNSRRNLALRSGRHSSGAAALSYTHAPTFASSCRWERRPPGHALDKAANEQLKNVKGCSTVIKKLDGGKFSSGNSLPT